ncbi:MAG: AsmA family protein, partial [Crocinitomicaceae bacterium]|nr:AsmA family protein [Crocinitomicaceae bacterium]
MTKLLKISGRTLLVLFEWLVILLIFVAFTIRSYRVQTYIAKQVASYLSAELDAEINIGKVDILYPDRLALDDFIMFDQSGDTLFAGETVFVTLENFDITKQKYDIRKVFIENGYVHIQKDTAGIMNLQYLKDYFSSDKPKTSNNKNLTFNIKEVGLSNCTFRYDDNRKEKIKRGVDYFHLFASNIDCTIDDITLSKYTIQGNVSGLSANERSGFKLKELKALSTISRKGVYLSDLNVKTDKSNITSSKFNMITNHFNDFKHFLDSVHLEARIDKSIISMEDVAYFGHPLYGMNELVTIETNINQTVNNLKISNLDLRIKDKTHIKGTINLPNFKKLEDEVVSERLNYAYIDLEELRKLKLPDSSPYEFIPLTPEINRLDYVSTKNLLFKYNKEDFSINFDDIKTDLGRVQLAQELLLTKSSDSDSYLFNQSNSELSTIIINEFNLGAFINNSTLGIVSGELSTSGEVFGTKDIRFNEITGLIDHFEYLNYPYTNISIDNGSFANKVIQGSITVNDQNLKLAYEGKIDLKGNKTRIRDAELDILGFTTSNAKLNSSFFEIKMTGNNLNNFDGTVTTKEFVYTEKDKELRIDNLSVNIDRGEKEDIFKITSSTIANAEIKGKMDFNHLWGDMNYQFSRVFPALYSKEPDPAREHLNDFFTYNINVINIDEFLAIFSPDLCVAQQT